jgi:uncharacterized protein
MRYEWDEEKRKSNLKDHRLDFEDAKLVFDGFTATYEDNRFRYEEQRWVTLGLLRGVPVSVVHTEQVDVIRIISFRRATPHETQFLFENIASELPPSAGQNTPSKTDRRASRARPKSRRPRHRKERPKTRPS